MTPLLLALAGALWGGLTARRRGGNRLDIAQYAAGYAVALGLAGLFATVLIARLR